MSYITINDDEYGIEDVPKEDMDRMNEEGLNIKGEVKRDAGGGERWGVVGRGIQCANE